MGDEHDADRFQPGTSCTSCAGRVGGGCGGSHCLLIMTAEILAASAWKLLVRSARRFEIAEMDCVCARPWFRCWQTPSPA